MEAPRPAISARDVSVYYGDKQAVFDLSLDIPERSIVALIGPSGCGKSTFLRALNRLNDFIPGVRTEGQVSFKDQDLYSRDTDPVAIRRSIGMVFQRPNPFPSSIEKNVSWGPSINGYRGNIAGLVEDSLRKAALWSEVKDKLDQSGLSLSGGQQQRLCIARAIAMDPDVILFDEPCSALDPASTAKIEDLLLELKRNYTVVIVTHNMQQAARISDYTAFLYEGKLIEFGPTRTIFQHAKHQLTRDYVAGNFG